MQRVTISIDDALASELDRMSRDRHYGSRSEAVRDLVRAGLEEWRSEGDGAGLCVANLSYIVDRRVRTLPQRIAEMQHAHHDLIGASTVVRLDHYHSLETVILKGSVQAVRSFADKVRAERGVRFGAINLLLVTPGIPQHVEHDHVHQDHEHLSPA